MMWITYRQNGNYRRRIKMRAELRKVMDEAAQEFEKYEDMKAVRAAVHAALSH